MKHLVTQPHAILSVENSPYPDKVKSQISHEDAIKYLQSLGGGQVHGISGHYGSPEKSIFISNPSEEQLRAIRQLAHETGQESHIESTGQDHSMYYSHGPQAGKVVSGKGTQFHEQAPKDFFSTIGENVHFTHNFDFGDDVKKSDKIPGGLAEGKKPSDFPKLKIRQGKKVEMEHTSDPRVAEEIAMDHLTEDPNYYEKLKTIETKKSEPLMKPYTSEAQRRWAHTEAGTKALGGKKAVREWDKKTKGKRLPEKMQKALSPKELKSQGYSFRFYDGNKGYYVIQAFHGKNKIGHVAYTRDPVKNSLSKDHGYHKVRVGHIEPEHQKKGLYRHMLNMAKEHVKSLGSKGIMSEGYQRSKAATQAWDKVATHADPYTNNAMAARKLSPEDSDYYLAASELRKNKVAETFLAGILGMSSAQVAADLPKIQVQQQQKHPYDDFHYRMKDTISQVESSGGKNVAHAPLPEEGIHSGTRAFGKYGITPVVTRGTARLNPDISNRHPELLKLPLNKINGYLRKNPGLEDEIADRHIKRLRGHFGDDPVKIGHAWLNGITGTKRAIKENRPIHDHWHVKKIKRAFDSLSKEPMGKSNYGPKQLGLYSQAENVRRAIKDMPTDEHIKLHAERKKKTKPSLQKMSRPRITFPNFPKVTTRPDQEVQPIQTERQKQIYSIKAVSPHYSKEKYSPRHPPSHVDPDKWSRMAETARAQGKESEIKTVNRALDNKYLGVNIDTPHGPKSAAWTGRPLVSRIGINPEQRKYLDEVAKKRNEHNEKVRAWNAKYQEWLRMPHDHPDKQKVRSILDVEKEKIGRVKPTRKPSKKKLETQPVSGLSPKEYKEYGLKYQTSLEHEGLHHLLDQIAHKYGKEESQRALQTIIDSHDKEALSAVAKFISNNYRYDNSNKHFSEEVINHARDLLIDPRKRAFFAEYVGADKAKEYLAKLKVGHQRAYEAAKKLTPQAGAGQEAIPGQSKLAASENESRAKTVASSWRLPQKPKKTKVTQKWVEAEPFPIEEAAPAPAMEKGAARRLYGKLDTLSLPDREKVKEWQTSTMVLQDLDSSYDDEQHQAVREELPSMDPGQKLRALNKLSNRTLTRRNPETGERQFLLFRGIGADEFHTISGGHIHNPGSRSSWTPHINVARGFESDWEDDHNKAKTIAAWVNESDIHAAPHMYGAIPGLKVDMDNAGQFYVPKARYKGAKNEFSDEHEIIVGPHKSMRATKEDVKRYQAIHTPTRTKISMADPKKDLNARINYRGERQKSGFGSTKQYPLIRETKPLPSAVLEAAGIGMKKPKKMAASELAKNEEADKEARKIKENQQKPEAKKPHKFKAAKWTHPNGHSRCIICGDEERVGGMCEGLR